MKELGCNTRETWYVDCVATQAMTIDIDDKETPEAIWKAVKPHPEIDLSEPKEEVNPYEFIW